MLKTILTTLGWHYQPVGLGNVAECPQILAASIEVSATRLESGKGCQLAPGEARRRVPGGGG